VRSRAWRPTLETILVKHRISIAASAAVTFLRAAVGSSHFKRFARRDGGWGAQGPSLWVPIRANFLIQAPATRARTFPRSRSSKSRASRGSFPAVAARCMCTSQPAILCRVRVSTCRSSAPPTTDQKLAAAVTPAYSLSASRPIHQSPGRGFSTVMVSSFEKALRDA
jgi:hypothetical protein